jgi:ectoine hydroxylase-related dioxygenase (phytanoyl-CoA dioxygenase family)
VGGATGWHQDAPLWPSIEPMTPVSAWIPLEHADIENGCMWMVPGSHKWGEQMGYLGKHAGRKALAEFTQIGDDFTPPADAPIREIRVVPCPVRRGEVHYHHSLTWHGSPMNASPRARPAVAIHYMTGAARYTGRGHVMQQFIQVQPGEAMIHAGPHFPVVCRAGRPQAPA